MTMTTLNAGTIYTRDQLNAVAASGQTGKTQLTKYIQETRNGEALKVQTAEAPLFGETLPDGSPWEGWISPVFKPVGGGVKSIVMMQPDALVEYILSCYEAWGRKAASAAVVSPTTGTPTAAAAKKAAPAAVKPAAAPNEPTAAPVDLSGVMERLEGLAAGQARLSEMSQYTMRTAWEAREVGYNVAMLLQGEETMAAIRESLAELRQTAPYEEMQGGDSDPT